MASRRDGPLIVQSDKTVLLDVHHAMAEEARERLASFAELLKTPDNLHTYRISALSLWNAAASGLGREEVVEVLETYARNPVARSIKRDIEALMGRFGGIILRLKSGCC